MSGISTRSALSADRPFPGLRPYRFEDKDFFFGRQDQIFALYRLFDHSRFVAVVGSSGSGKSSLVRAGLLPLLSKESQEPTGRIWKMIQMHPGDAPLESLAASMAQQFFPNDDASVAAARRERFGFELRRSSFGMSDTLQEIDDLGNTSIVLVVDQFEELFRYARRQAEGDPEAQRHEEATQFVQVLLAASRDRALNVYVLLTMRSDFIGDCANFHSLPEAVSASQFLVPSLTRNQREEAIRLPIENAGATIEPELVERLLNDSSDDVDQLPVLQHCVLRVWEAAGLSAAATGSHARCLTARNYEDVGGIAHALSKHADEILEGLRGAELAVQQVFRSLAEIDLEGRIVRRALPYKDLLAETGVTADQLRTVVDRFRDDDCSFLTPSKWEKPELTDGTRVDVGHEALLRRWERVSGDPRTGSHYTGWIREEVADGRAYRGLLAMAESRDRISTDTVEERWKRWKERPRTAAWAERYGGHIEDVERLFTESLNVLEAERERQHRQAEAEREQERRRIEDAAERQRMKLEAEAAREREAAALHLARVTRTAAIAISLLLLIAVGVSLLALWQRSVIANQQAAVAEQNIQTSLKLATAAQDEIQGLLDRGEITVAGAKVLLDSAKTMYPQFIGRDQDSEMVSSLAKLLLAFADTYMALQDHKTALQVSKQAQTTAQQLVATDTNNGDYQFLLYRADYSRGDAEAYTPASVPDAMQDYQAALGIAQTFAKSDPTHYVWMQRVPFIMHKIADTYQQLEQPKQALATYQSALDINQQLATDHPNIFELQRDLATSLTRVGDAEADADRSGALVKYENALVIRQALATQHPTDASMQSNLSVAYNRVADILVLQTRFADASIDYNAALAIRQNLAKSDRGNPTWQGNLAAEYGHIGDMLVAKKDFSGAVDNYKQAAAIRNALSTLDPYNYSWLENLADSDVKLAAALADQGDLAAALHEHESALALRKKIAAEFPDETARQRALIDEYVAIGDVLVKQNDPGSAAEQYQNALNVAQDFQAKHPADTSLTSDLQLITQKIESLKVYSTTSQP